MTVCKFISEADGQEGDSLKTEEKSWKPALFIVLNILDMKCVLVLGFQRLVKAIA